MSYLIFYGLVIGGVLTAHIVILLVNLVISGQLNKAYRQGISEGRAMEYNEQCRLEHIDEDHE